MYKLDYDSTELPTKNSFATDYWGYYNGMLNNINCIPDPIKHNYSNMFTNGNNKGANLTYAKAGILEKITYPTGGCTLFEYELNQFDNIWYPEFNSSANSISSGNGLRIKNIKTNNLATNKNKVATYKYTNGIQITPSLTFREFPYTFLGTNHLPGCLDIYYNYYNEVSATSSFYSSNAFSSYTGVGYGKVEVQYISEDTLSKIGSIISEYSNNTDIVNTAISSFTKTGNIPVIKQYTNPTNGIIKSKKIFDKNYKLLVEEDYEYENRLSNLFYGAKIFPFSTIFYSDGRDCAEELNTRQRHLISFYPIFDYETLLNKKIINTYDQISNNKIKKEVYYGYDLMNRLTEEKKYENNMTKIKVIDYTTDQFGFDQSFIFYNRNIMNEIGSLKLKTSINFNDLTETVVRNKYELVDNKIKIVETKTLNNLNQFQPFGKLISQFNYEQFDDNLNLLQYKDYKSTRNSLIWDYNKMYLTAEIINSNYSDVGVTSFENDGKGNLNFNGVPLFDNDAPTGDKVYNLNSGSISKMSMKIKNILSHYGIKETHYILQMVLH